MEWFALLKLSHLVAAIDYTVILSISTHACRRALQSGGQYAWPVHSHTSGMFWIVLSVSRLHLPEQPPSLSGALLKFVYLDQWPHCVLPVFKKKTFIDDTHGGNVQLLQILTQDFCFDIDTNTHYAHYFKTLKKLCCYFWIATSSPHITITLHFCWVDYH